MFACGCRPALLPAQKPKDITASCVDAALTHQHTQTFWEVVSVSKAKQTEECSSLNCQKEICMTEIPELKSTTSSWEGRSILSNIFNKKKKNSQKTNLMCLHARCLRRSGWMWKLSAKIQITMSNTRAVLSGVTPGGKHTSCYWSAQKDLNPLSAFWAQQHYKGYK